MSKERLSDLQSRILHALDRTNGFLTADSFHWYIYYPDDNKRSYSASLSRSLRNLEKKGLIKIDYKQCFRHKRVNKISKVVNIKKELHQNSELEIGIK